MSVETPGDALAEERRIVEVLQEVGAALTAELDLARLLQVFTDAATRVSGAAYGAFFHNVVDEAGGSYLLHTLSGAPAGAFAGFPAPRITVLFAPTYEGTDVVRLDDVTADPRYGAVPPHFGMPAGHLPVRSYLAVPVVSRTGAVLGGLFLGHADPGVFGDRVEQLVVGIAAHAAIAIDNARLFQSAERARREAERSAARLGALQALTARLASARSAGEVGEVVVDAAARGLGADAVAICLLNADGSAFELLASHGLRPDTVAQWQRFPAGAPVPAADAARTGEPVLFGSLAERDRLYPIFRGQPSAHQAFATAPLRLGDRALGALTLGWDEARDFEDDDVRFVVAVADQCAQALDRARLAEAERAAARRQAFLAEASLVLASSLDYEHTLARVGRLLVPALADSSSVFLLEPRGLRLVDVANARPEREELMRVLAAREGEFVTNPELDRIVRTGEPGFYPVVPSELLAAMADDEEHARLLRRLGVASGMAVPMRTREATIGVLAVTRSAGRAPFEPADLDLVADLAGRAGLAISHARAHRERTELARTLQRSLLPPRQPEVPGLELACRYHPVGDGSEVGGDFYDVFPLGDGGFGVVVGDVSGKGATAATLTALARATVRVAALGQPGPSAVLRLLNRAIIDHDVGERFCTIACAFVHPGPGAARVVVACGGHPLPYLLPASGPPRLVGRPGTCIGLFAEPDLTDVEVALGPGDALVLYTDGLVEARSPAGDFANDLLAATLAERAWAGAEEVAAAVEERILAFQGGSPRDDLALLVLRLPQ